MDCYGVLRVDCYCGYTEYKQQNFVHLSEIFELQEANKLIEYQVLSG